MPLSSTPKRCASATRPPIVVPIERADAEEREHRRHPARARARPRPSAAARDSENAQKTPPAARAVITMDSQTCRSR